MRATTSGLFAAGLAVLSSPPAIAEPPEPVATATVTSTTSAAAYRVPPEALPGGPPWARAALWVPRGLLAVLSALPRGIGWVIDELKLPATFEAVFFDDTLTYGAFPVLTVETPFGVQVGLRALHRSLFGQGEQLRLAAQVGQRATELYSLDLDTGRRLGRTRVVARARFERGSRLIYQGLNAPQGPRTEARRRTVYARLRVERSFGPQLEGAVEVGWWNDDYGPPLDDDVRSAETLSVPDPFTFRVEDIDTLEGALEVIYDGQRSTAAFAPPAVPSEGLRLGARLGVDRVLENQGLTYMRYTLEVEQRFDLWRGTRILAVGARLSGVGGPIDRIPVFDLPALGGPRHLRGFARGALRGPQAFAAQVEYLFPLEPFVVGFLFADVGRTFTRLEDWRSGPEVSAGLGLEAYMWERSLGRLHLGVSGRGDVQFTFGVATDYNLDGRQDR